MEDLNLLRKDNVRSTYSDEMSEYELAEAYEKVRSKYRKQGIYLPDNKMEIDIESLAWKTSHYSKVPPNIAYAEIERIKVKYNGLLTAEILLDESKPEKSVFHDCFNWDNDEAADLYRIQQARGILKNITLTIISNGESKKVRVYEVVKKENGSIYKSVNTFNDADLAFIQSQAAKGLNQYRNKLSIYQQFSTVVNHLDNAIDELSAVKVS